MRIWFQRTLYMKRRDFMRLSGATAGGTAVAGSAAAQDNSSANGSSGGNASGGGNASNGSGGGGGSTTTVQVGPGGQLVFQPEEIEIATGDTVEWVWQSGGHNVVPEGGGDWGHEPLENAGFSYSHTFEEAGEVSYVCQPHASAGMAGAIAVGGGSGGGGEEEVDPEEMGVPFQAHYVGIATVLMMIISLGYSFFLLKYGESPNAKGGNN
jgi:plastocyanin